MQHNGEYLVKWVIVFGAYAQVTRQAAAPCRTRPAYVSALLCKGRYVLSLSCISQWIVDQTVSVWTVALTHKFIYQSLFQLSLGVGQFPPLSNLQSPPNDCQIMCSKSFFRPGQWITNKSMETLFSWTIKTGNYSSVNNQKGANLCLKCTKMRLAAGFCPDPLGELMRSPIPSSHNGGLFLMGERWKRRGLLLGS